jgi:clan AA aspartic protease
MMGVFTVPIRVENLEDERFIDLEATVDTAATYTFISEDILDQLGVERAGQRTFELGDNRIVDYPIGYVRLRVNGDQVITFVVFGPKDSEPLLGVTALELLSVGVDPVNQRLVQVRASR